MRILLAGGGTGGPVMPLIAVAKRIKEEDPKAHFLLVGTSSGLEREIAEKNRVKFVSVPAGKWRRYFSVMNLISPFLVLAGFLKALFIISRFKPDALFSAGGFVSVPVAYAAFVLRKKIVIHQQDALPSLTNKILAPIASRITVSFEHSLKDFHSGSGLFSHGGRTPKIFWTGNPVRENLLDPSEKSEAKVKEELKLRKDLPTILVLGGATGAAGLNAVIQNALPDLVQFANVVHSTGKGKAIQFKNENYHPFEFILNMREMYEVADIVISRAGLSTISELSALKKVSIIVPLPDSHQLANAYILAKVNAALVFDQDDLYSETLVNIIRKLMIDGEWQRELSENIGKVMPKNATQKIADIIMELCQKKH